MKTLCESEEIPQQFAYKIIRKLARAGLVQSIRGNDGGCQLIGDLRRTSLYDLMEIMEEDSQLIACMEPGYRCQWEMKKQGSCKVHQQLARLQSKLNNELRAQSLHNLIFGES